MALFLVSFSFLPCALVHRNVSFDWLVAIEFSVETSSKFSFDATQSTGLYAESNGKRDRAHLNVYSFYVSKHFLPFRFQPIMKRTNLHPRDLLDCSVAKEALHTAQNTEWKYEEKKICKNYSSFFACWHKEKIQKPLFFFNLFLAEPLVLEFLVFVLCGVVLVHFL